MKIINRIKNKNGNVMAVVVITAIMVSVIMLMGLEFSKKTKGAIISEVGKTNSGLEYQINNISKEKVNDAGK